MSAPVNDNGGKISPPTQTGGVLTGAHDSVHDLNQEVLREFVREMARRHAIADFNARFRGTV